MDGLEVKFAALLVATADVKTLRHTAQLTASKIGRARTSKSELAWPTLPALDPVRTP